MAISHAVLRNFSDGAECRLRRWRAAALGANLMRLVAISRARGFGVFYGAGAGAGETDVERVDAERFHQVEDFDFFFDAGIVDGGIFAGRRGRVSFVLGGRACRAGISGVGGLVPVVIRSFLHDCSLAAC